MAAAAVTSLPTGSVIILRNNAHGKFLGTEGKTLYLSPNKQEWEQWTVVNAGAGQFFLHNAAHKQNVVCFHDGKSNASPNQQAYEKLLVVNNPKGNGGFAIQSNEFKLYMSADNSAKGNVSFSKNLDAWESWTYELVRPGLGVKYYLKSRGHAGKYLSMTSTAANAEAKVELSGNTQAYEQWVFADAGAGKFFLTSAAHHKQVSVHHDKVIGSPNKDAYEKLSIQVVEGHLVFVSHHNTQISGLANGGTGPSPNKQGWEQWQLIAV